MRVSLAFFHPCHLASHPLSPTYSTLRLRALPFLPSFLALRSFVSASVLPSPPTPSLPLPPPSFLLPLNEGGARSAV